VKWGKESYEVEGGTDSLATFTALLFSLTNVPPERQKIMCKGKMIKDDASVAALKEGDKLVLMGSAAEAPKEPEKKIVFEEDLTDAQKIKSGAVKDLLSAGLENLGNTCYMASTLQSLRAIPELKQELIRKSQAGAGVQHDPQAAVVRQLGNLFSQMDATTKPVNPMMFTTVFRSTFAQFAETNGEGHWMQQDAEEAMMQLMNSMASVLRKEGAAAGSTDNVIDEFFGGKQETVTKPKLMPGEDAAAAAADTKAVVETYRRLRCFIDIETNFLYQGLKSGLTEELELRGRLYERSSTLLTLPRYLIVQMMRFGWRKDSNKKTKILRKVDFPMRLDVFDLCHPSLKKQLSCARNLIKEEQDAKLGLTSLNKKAKTDAGQTAGSTPAAAAAASSAAPAAAAASSSPAPMDVDASAASNPWSGSASCAAAGSGATGPNTLMVPTSGSYELFALVTHKGRTSDSGHYMSYTKAAGSADWLKFDDDVVTRVTEDDIKVLHGGGDRDMAYLLFYRRVDDAEKFKGAHVPEMPSVLKPEESKKDASASASASAAK